MNTKKEISAVILMAMMTGSSLQAAQLIDLKNYPVQVLQSFSSYPIPLPVSVKEINRFIDTNKITHIRMQEYYHEYPIWNAHAVMHVFQSSAANKRLPELLHQTSVQKSMNGKLYQQLDEDLKKAPSIVFSKQQEERALKFAIESYKSDHPERRHLAATNSAHQLLIFIDQHHEAHWAFKVNFSVPIAKMGDLPAKPAYIIDATHFKIYQNWDDIQTAASEEGWVRGGGLGGNPKIGKLYYDGFAQHLSSFIVKRTAGICYLQNKDTEVKHAQTGEVMQYPCSSQHTEHNNVYWSGDFDKVNQGYSPANDAMFSAQVIQHLYKDWYNLPVLLNTNGSERVLHMNVHYPHMDNAFWDGSEMTFGDGTALYPLTSLGIAAHEVSHGFTEQHSNLMYEGQSGGINESFSDMAAQVAEYYAYGHNSWQIGSEVLKLEHETLRYMDQPSKDCHGKEPGTFCSIDQADQYYAGLNVHFSSGVFNRAFYLLSTLPDWNPRKAFAVMLHANASYWLPESQFVDAAACAIKAAEDLHYDKNAVAKAFSAVGLAANERCTNSDV